MDPSQDPEKKMSEYGTECNAVIQYGNGFGTWSFLSSSLASPEADVSAIVALRPCARYWVKIGFFLASDHKETDPLSDPVMKWESSTIVTQSIEPSASVTTSEGQSGFISNLPKHGGSISGTNGNTTLLAQSSDISHKILMTI
ncbi:hypothetical protein WICPIJ_006411 [Wickerhamomyces pijperi]|uniref:Uncharacterized protein n=1 Tax=Wickerhamomyces pijperi TaxID=599730 RepID=A0A9P8Q1T5_WICPI|nr:hypothetical protein WICPIJ_006411 [Wickerhamomyces pijperi]